MSPLIEVIIPTYNNPEYVNPCIQSIISTTAYRYGILSILVVNNGKQPLKDQLKEAERIRVIDAQENLGWEDGLKLGLEHSSSKFVVFQNDDTFIPQVSIRFYENLLYHFHDPQVGIVGPVTTIASGIQSIYHPSSPSLDTEVPYLIFFCAMIRRQFLDELGGIDETLPGGDDFDLSIRMRKAGRKLIVSPKAFLIHHAFKTGERLKGGRDQDGGWNSVQMIDRTNHALIRKHGFRTFLETMRGTYHPTLEEDLTDYEGDLIRSSINGEQTVLELGCGAKKTISQSTGVDRISKGEPIPFMNGRLSVAEVKADVQEPLPFPDESQEIIIARHLLEHCVDLIWTLKGWIRVLKKGGRLIVAVPDEDIVSGIPLNPEHVHAFTKNSLTHLMSAVGLKKISTEYTGNHCSFVGVFEKL